MIRRSIPFKNCICTLFIILFYTCSVYGSSALIAQSSESLPDFTKLVKNASPAVVSIVTVESVNPNKQLVPDNLRDALANTPLMDQLREMYGDKLEEKLFGKENSGLGSGTIISDDGYVITNLHVVHGASKIYVALKDRTEYPAKLIGYDRGTDLALLKVEAKNLPYLKFSNEPVDVGQWVLAIGAPYGFEDTLTVGVVSAKRRSLGQEKYVPFIQTDVAINPGNSGGPLLNLKGEVVGINSQIVSESGGFSGLSFAAPSHVIENVIKQIKARGYVERGWLGLAFQNLDRDLAESFGVSHSSGALVSKVIPGSPADKAGFKMGDIIIDINQRAVRHANDVAPLVGLLPIGSKVNIEVIRNAKPKILVLKTERAPLNRKSHALSVIKQTRVSAGIKVRNIAKDELHGSVEQGVIVTRMYSSPWRISHLNVGDIVLRVNHTPVKSAEQFYKIIKNADKNKPLSLLVTRDGRIQKYVAVRLK